MRIVVISDTHGQHEKLGTLRGDVLIHCGDIETLLQPNRRGAGDIVDWFGKQQFEQIYCIGGNHDTDLERKAKVKDQPFANATWLHERAVTYRAWSSTVPRGCRCSTVIPSMRMTMRWSAPGPAYLIASTF